MTGKTFKTDFSNRSQAEELAPSANLAARKNVVMRTQNNILSSRADNWDHIMSRTSPYIYTLVFCILTILDGFLSRDLYLEVAHSKDWWWVPVLILLLVSLKISDWLRGINVSLRKWEEYEMKETFPHKLDEEVRSTVWNEIKKDLYFYGIPSLIFLCGFVLLCSYYRCSILHRGFTIVDLFPALAYFFTIIAGIFVPYTIRRLLLKFKVEKVNKLKDDYLNNCVLLTNRAGEYYNKAKKANEDLMDLSSDLKITLKRYFYKNSVSDDYTDPYISFHTVIILDNNNSPKEKVIVKGSTSANNPTEVVFSDSNGIAKLTWNDGSDFLSLINVNGKEYSGVYNEGETSLIRESLDDNKDTLKKVG